jgi:hypothetical protein
MATDNLSIFLSLLTDPAILISANVTTLTYTGNYTSTAGNNTALGVTYDNLNHKVVMALGMSPGKVDQIDVSDPANMVSTANWTGTSGQNGAQLPICFGEYTYVPLFTATPKVAQVYSSNMTTKAVWTASDTPSYQVGSVGMTVIGSSIFVASDTAANSTNPGYIWQINPATMATVNHVPTQVCTTSFGFTDGDFSAELWAKFDQISTIPYLIKSGGYTEVDSWEIYIQPSGRLTLGTSQFSGDQYTYSGAGTITTGTWYHLAVTRSGAVGKVYIDGVDATTTSGTHVNPSPAEESSLKIGYLGTGTPNYITDGIIGEVRIYDDVLTPAEVLQNYNATKSTYEGGNPPIYVPNNSEAWVCCQATDGYLEYQEIQIGGVQRQYITWQYAEVFLDQSGNGNTGFPSFRTSSTDADVSANLTTFKPVSEAKAPAYTLSTNAYDFISDNITMSGDFSVTPSGSYPGKAILDDIAAATDTPVQLPVILIGTFITIAASLSATYFLKKHGEGSLIFKIIVICIFMGLAIALTAFDFWMIIFFALLATALGMASRHFAW